MKLGVNTFLWTSEFTPAHLDLLPRIKAAGFDGVELPVAQPATFRAADVRRALEANGLACTVCSVILDRFNLVDDDPSVRQRTQRHVRDVVQVAAEIGASLVNGPLYAPVGSLPGGRRTEDEWQRAI